MRKCIAFCRFALIALGAFVSYMVVFAALIESEPVSPLRSLAAALFTTALFPAFAMLRRRVHRVAQVGANLAAMGVWAALAAAISFVAAAEFIDSAGVPGAGAGLVTVLACALFAPLVVSAYAAHRSWGRAATC